MDVKFLEKLCNADALAGFEDEVRQLMLKELKSFSDEVLTDNIGSLVFKKTGKADGPKILLTAHMDEVGFRVRHICENGKILVKPVGAVKQLAKFYQGVRITTYAGKKVNGVLHSTYTEDEDSKNIPGDTYVDLGLSSDEDVKKLGVEVGNIVCFDSNFKNSVNNLVMGKAFDDRIGCYIIAKVLENLKKKKHPNTVYAAATSSEETGLRGARTVSELVKPDVGFAADACCYKDSFDKSATNSRQVGNGMILIHNDRGFESNAKLYKLVQDEAKKQKLNLQLDMFESGSTDGANIFINGIGVPTQVCCVPLRYGHCSYSIANTKDIDDAINIITEVICKIDTKTAKDFVSFI